MPDLLAVRTSGQGGVFRIFWRPPGGKRKEVTFFRDVPTQINQLSTTDPFGDATAALTFPAITGFDRPGTGDISWLVPWSDVDIVYYDQSGAPTNYVWEGFMVSEEIAGSGLQVQLKGALYQLDNFLAAPFFPQYPVPYERLIADAFDPKKHPSLRTSPLKIEWPANWNKFVPRRAEPLYLNFLRPYGVRPGQKWTERTTRNTGGWDPLLTSFVQTLLSVMYTDDGGQWTVYKRTGRVPVLQVRPALRYPTSSTLEVFYGAPGVEVSFSRDFTQSANVIYGAGTDLQGTTFSGQQVTPDGMTTYYEPFAALPQIYPAKATNPRLLTHLARKESRLSFPNGMDEQSARDVAATQLMRFADPGFVGNITLSADPLLGGTPFSRLLIKAGQTILLRNFRRTDVLFHISSASINVENGTAELTVDTKFRDALTTAEVRARTRDALDPVRMLQVGKYSVTVQDEIMPWSYSSGSGVVPSDPATYDATMLFRTMPAGIQFPWTEWTTKHPPKNKSYAKYYIPLGKVSTNANNNWTGISRDGKKVAAIPIRMSQSGQIRLSQFAAYDRDGYPVPVKFHVSLYSSSGTNYLSMPKIPAKYNKKFGPEGKAASYLADQRYPFYPGAFENQNPDGTVTDNPGQLVAQGTDLVIGWGNYYEPGGYSPGMKSAGAHKTGRIVDEQVWEFSTINDPAFNKYSVVETMNHKYAGFLYLMIYCDDHVDDDVYFLGRLFRQEPGTR